MMKPSLLFPLALLCCLVAIRPAAAHTAQHKNAKTDPPASAFLQLKPQATPPVPCDAAHKGALAIRARGGLCLCRSLSPQEPPFWAYETTGQPCWGSSK